MDGIFRLGGASKRDPEVDIWLDERPADLGPLARFWFEKLRACGSDVRELMHDGFATACVQDAPFAYIGTYKAHVNVGFFRGAALKDPVGLLEGEGKRMRHVKLKPGSPIDTAALERLVQEAYADIKKRLTAA
jgi:hypothetical protein